MFWIKLIVAVVSLFLFRLVNNTLEDDELDTIMESDYAKILGIITIIEFITAIALAIIFCILMAVTSWNIMIIPKIMLFISFCLYAFFKDGWLFLIGIFSTFVVFIFTGSIYLIILLLKCNVHIINENVLNNIIKS